MSGKVWAGYINQKTEAGTGATHDTQTANAWELGGKISYAGFGLVGYYYDGQNMGIPLMAGATQLTGLTITWNGPKDHDVSGGYVQGTYTIPNIGTKIGLSWGESNYDKNSTNVGPTFDDYKNESWVVGVYHPLTKALNLVAEYNDTSIQNNGLVKNQDGKAKTISLGAIMFF